MCDASTTDNPKIAASCNETVAAAALRIRNTWCVLNMRAKVASATDTLQG